MKRLAIFFFVFVSWQAKLKDFCDEHYEINPYTHEFTHNKITTCEHSYAWLIREFNTGHEAGEFIAKAPKEASHFLIEKNPKVHRDIIGNLIFETENVFFYCQNGKEVCQYVN